MNKYFLYRVFIKIWNDFEFHKIEKKQLLDGFVSLDLNKIPLLFKEMGERIAPF